MRILLLCNYPPDQQQSMLRFGRLLQEAGAARGWDMSSIAPEHSSIASRISRLLHGRGGKWIGYLDKYVLFPPRLGRTLHGERGRTGGRGRLIVHVVDHSNAVYIPRAADTQIAWVATCHDLLAVRGALGEATGCPASLPGRRLQRAIVRGLGRAAAAVCDSTSTLHDVDRLVPAQTSQLRRVILLGLNHPYRRITVDEARARLASIGGIPWEQPYLLHVGSNLPRKNKEGVLRVFARLARRWPGNVVFCGEGLAPQLRAQAASAGLSGRVFACAAPTNAELEAAYSHAHALVYPSTCEGFGWPVIEAQACGCPVVCSDRTSLPEVGGDAALVHRLEDEAGMAESLLRLLEPGCRAGVIARGHANLKRFATDRMIDAYGQVYEEVLAASASR